MNKLIVYGDIHGCFNELEELRNSLNIQSNDAEVCVGDILTKGKDSIKTLRYIQKNNILSVLGNHLLPQTPCSATCFLELVRPKHLAFENQLS